MDEREKELTLEQCEAIIQEGIDMMQKADYAFFVINDLNLFSKKHKSFEEYCKSEWSVHDINNYILIKSNKKKIKLPLDSENILRRIHEPK